MLTVVVVTVLAAVAIGAGVALFSLVKPDPTTSSRGVVTAFMNDLRDGDYSDARDLLCADGQRQIPDGKALVDRLGIPEAGISGYTISSILTGAQLQGEKGDQASVLVDIDGEQRQFGLFVVSEGGRRAICGYGWLEQ
jgi:hypothetical protein